MPNGTGVGVGDAWLKLRRTRAAYTRSSLRSTTKFSARFSITGSNASSRISIFRRARRFLKSAPAPALLFRPIPLIAKSLGIDLAPDMLARARQKILENGWRHLKVIEMNALDLEFPDNSFDYVMAFHVVTVVPDPIRMIAEAKRVCKPGGKIVIVNHFTSDVPLLGIAHSSHGPHHPLAGLAHRSQAQTVYRNRLI